MKTAFEQVAELTAERDTLKAAIDTANAAVASLTEQAATLGSELESARAAITERDALAGRVAAMESEKAEEGKRTAEAIAKVAELEAALLHKPSAYADATSGTAPLAVATPPADAVHIFSRAEIAKMSRADYAKNRKAILEQMAKGQVK